MFFTGSLTVDEGGGPMAINGAISDMDGRIRILVRLDSVRMTPEQIAEHELGHLEFRGQPHVVAQSMRILEDEYGDALYELQADYARSFSNCYGEDWVRYLEEIYCDLKAGIRRRGAEIPEAAKAPLEQALGRARAETDGTESRGPPREGGEWYASDEDLIERSEDDEPILYRERPGRGSLGVGRTTGKLRSGGLEQNEREGKRRSHSQNNSKTKKQRLREKIKYISARDLGFPNGTRDKTARLLPEELWQESGCATLCEIIRAMGYEPVPFTGELYADAGAGKATIHHKRRQSAGRKKSSRRLFFQ
ncbi:MAG: hypothetical protein IJG63_04515 [Oscillospiraceae bacterium]|nr:hypothetical protein [Oscillospiraceae bacterium]